MKKMRKLMAWIKKKHFKNLKPQAETVKEMVREQGGRERDFSSNMSY